ncbi:MAG: hypothetical protein H0T62_02165 [Parachlamydiaceae bacterium]|nr:hypothetical protein [Parachlamydiaceae bacterium]
MVQLTPLEEKDFIHEEYRKNPFPFWKWLSAVIVVTMLLLGACSLYFSMLSDQYTHSPFLQVTNRQISIFLWQNPQYMRVHVKNKSGYLPAFNYAERIGLNPEYADDYVIAPPELLFLYHTWKRLIGDLVFPRIISKKEFSMFLVAVPEWDPRFWRDAPLKYQNLISSFSEISTFDMATLDVETLPKEVRQAFIGWKNYFFEGAQINAMQPTGDEIAEFIKKNPHFGRSYWCNIVGNSYLQNESGELSSFLRASIYNFLSR